MYPTFSWQQILECDNNGDEDDKQLALQDLVLRLKLWKHELEHIEKSDLTEFESKILRYLQCK